VELSLRHVNSGGVPFAAMVLDADGRVLGRGVNQVREHHDPTAHAEVQAMRNACARTGATRLPGTILLASGEPCALCYLAALYTGVPQIWFAASRDEAAAHGFDYRDTTGSLRAIRWIGPPPPRRGSRCRRPTCPFIRTEHAAARHEP